LWFAGAYSLTFTETNGGIIGGLGKAWLSGVELDSLNGAIPETVFSMFQLTFAIITPALIVGAFAERMRFSAMLIFSLIWLLLFYGPIVHGAWGGRCVGGWGFRGFAGGAVVHVNAGVAALGAALVIGNRRDFPTPPILPDNHTMTVTGASMLWAGWYGFNA